MNYRSYMHVERMGTDEVEGIEKGGTVFATVKLDGTNGVVWWEDGEIKAGSRKRELNIEKDNAGFFTFVKEDEGIRAFYEFEENRDLVLYGEWLIHNHVHYIDKAYRKFYVFDVWDSTDERYISPDFWTNIRGMNDLLWVPIISAWKESECEETFDEFIKRCLDDEVSNRYVKDGLGEGVVLKNYEFINKWGRTVWGKVVRQEYTQAKKTPKPKEDSEVESAIADAYITQAFCEKTLDKMKLELGEWKSEYIGRFLGVIWYEFINEEMWHVLKKFKMPKIDFKMLQKQVTECAKLRTPEVFGTCHDA